MTCAKFVKQSPTCVDFDEKLLFYYNMRRAIESALDVKDFRCIRLQLQPLKVAELFIPKNCKLFYSLTSIVRQVLFLNTTFALTSPGALSL